MQCGLHDGHPEKSTSLVEFADEIALEMISNQENDLSDGPTSRSAGRRRSVEIPAAIELEAAVLPKNVHRFGSYGYASEQPGWQGKTNYSVQHNCVECRQSEGAPKVRTTAFCAAEQCGKKIALCREGTGHHSRPCMQRHKERCADAGAFVSISSSV
jgi:hypothetical protein